jgi:ribosome-binding protein aMBF1 (putative translation factor)
MGLAHDLAELTHKQGRRPGQVILMRRASVDRIMDTVPDNAEAPATLDHGSEAPPSAFSSSSTMKYPEGTLVCSERERRGMKQCWLATQAGIDQHRLSDIERGKVRPYWDEMVRLAMILDRRLDELVPPGETFTDRHAGQRTKGTVPEHKQRETCGPTPNGTLQVQR